MRTSSDICVCSLDALTLHLEKLTAVIHVPPSSERREGVPLTVSIPCGWVGPSGIKYRGSGFAEVERGPVIIHLSSVASGCLHDHHGTSVTGLAAAKKRADIIDHALVALRDRHDRTEEDARSVVLEVPQRRLPRCALEVRHVQTLSAAPVSITPAAFLSSESVGVALTPNVGFIARL